MTLTCSHPEIVVDDERVEIRCGLCGKVALRGREAAQVVTLRARAREEEARARSLLERGFARDP